MCFIRLTKFGNEPPKNWRVIKKQIQRSYPIFTPKSGSVASLDKGMETLTNALIDKINQLDISNYDQNYLNNTFVEIL